MLGGEDPGWSVIRKYTQPFFINCIYYYIYYYYDHSIIVMILLY